MTVARGAPGLSFMRLAEGEEVYVNLSTMLSKPPGGRAFASIARLASEVKATGREAVQECRVIGEPGKIGPRKEGES